jgi:predicted kinase
MLTAHENLMVCSADHFFLDAAGKYNFDPRKLPEAHAACLRKFVTLCQTAAPLSKVTILRGVPGSGKSTYIKGSVLNLGIIVDNTCTTLSEVAPYAALALAYNLVLQIVTIHCDPVEAGRRNIHGVPVEVVEKMAQRMADSDKNEMWPPWWNHTLVVSE